MEEISGPDIAISAARANLTELVAEVRLLRRALYLTRRDKRQAALVPIEVAEAVERAGGPDALVRLVNDALDTAE